MPNSSSIDIPHVSITDHKISIPKEMKKKEFGNFLGLFAINNSNPTNLSKAKAYLKRYESFEQIESYLDSAFSILRNVISSNVWMFLLIIIFYQKILE